MTGPGADCRRGYITSSCTCVRPALIRGGRRLQERVADTAATVGLTTDLSGRRAHAVSDGQLQRACLARALITGPRYLICDEMTTMLDASTTAALVTALAAYCAAEGAGVLAISHDDALLTHWADEVIQLGRSGVARVE